MERSVEVQRLGKQRASLPRADSIHYISIGERKSISMIALIMKHLQDSKVLRNVEQKCDNAASNAHSQRYHWQSYYDFQKTNPDEHE